MDSNWGSPVPEGCPCRGRAGRARLSLKWKASCARGAIGHAAVRDRGPAVCGDRMSATVGSESGAGKGGAPSPVELGDEVIYRGRPYLLDDEALVSRDGG